MVSKEGHQTSGGLSIGGTPRPCCKARPIISTNRIAIRALIHVNRRSSGFVRVGQSKRRPIMPTDLDAVSARKRKASWSALSSSLACLCCCSLTKAFQKQQSNCWGYFKSKATVMSLVEFLDRPGWWEAALARCRDPDAGGCRML